MKHTEPALEHLRLSLTRGLGRFPVGPIADLLHQRLVILPVEGHGAMHQDVEEDTQGPAVHLREGRNQQGGRHTTGQRTRSLTSSTREEKGTC